MSIREGIINDALLYLKKLSSPSSLSSKLAHLESRGLNQTEIAEAFRRYSSLQQTHGVLNDGRGGAGWIWKVLLPVFMVGTGLLMYNLSGGEEEFPLVVNNSNNNDDELAAAVDEENEAVDERSNIELLGRGLNLYNEHGVLEKALTEALAILNTQSVTSPTSSTEVVPEWAQEVCR